MSASASASSSLPTVAFSARTGAVLSGEGRLDDVDLSLLRFSAPKETAGGGGAGGEAEDGKKPAGGGSERSCTARAFLLPGKGALKVAFRGASIARVTHARRDAHTVFVEVAEGAGKRRGAPQQTHTRMHAFLATLDARVLEVAKANVTAWFSHRMNDDLVEEYYRGGLTGGGGGLLARFVVSGAPELPEPLAAGACVDVTMQLVGLQFRSQYFTCVWKVAAVRAADPPPAPPLRRASEDGGFFLLDDDEDDGGGEADGDDDSDLDEASLGPTAEVCAEMRQALASRLAAAEQAWADQAAAASGRVAAARAAADRLEAAPLSDLATLAELEEALETLTKM